MDESLDRALPPPEPGDPRPPFVPVAAVRPRPRVGARRCCSSLTDRHHDGGRRAALLLFPARVSAPRPRRRRSTSAIWWFYLPGLWYSGTVLAILGCHEMGHYLACRYYRVDASLPFFLPAPLPSDRHARRVHPHPPAHPVEDRAVRHRPGRPDRRLPRGRAGAVHGPGDVGRRTRARRTSPASSSASRCSSASPRGWSGATCRTACRSTCTRWRSRRGSVCWRRRSICFRSGQLDGGHVAYAVLGRRSTHHHDRHGARSPIGLTFVSTSWLVWTVLMVVMLVVMGPHHPPTLDDDTPLDRTRAGPRRRRAGDADRLLHARADRAVCGAVEGGAPIREQRR